MSAIVWDFRVARDAKDKEAESPPLLPQGAQAAKFVWCAQRQQDVPSQRCVCYMNNNHYFLGSRLCPPTPDGKSFRDPHD
jgi:hypothetical protein